MEWVIIWCPTCTALLQLERPRTEGGIEVAFTFVCAGLGGWAGSHHATAVDQENRPIRTLVIVGDRE